jgi:hypothetical protein
MPVIILTIVAIIYLAFFLYDKNRIQGVVDMTLHKIGVTVKHDADITTGKVDYERINQRGVFYMTFRNDIDQERIVKELLLRELSKGLFLAKLHRVEVNMERYKVAVRIEADINVSLPVINYLFAKLSLLEVKGEYTFHNPVETIRRTEVVLETGSKIKGIEDLKERLENFFK